MSETQFGIDFMLLDFRKLQEHAKLKIPIIPKFVHEKDDGIREKIRKDISKQTHCEWNTVEGSNTLRQAVIARLLTMHGELEALGHPEYGGDMLTWVGSRAYRNLVGDIKKNLEQDSRIQYVEVKLVQKFPRDVMTDLEVQIHVYPKNNIPPLRMEFSLNL